jgi:hypothetical protein
MELLLYYTRLRRYRLYKQPIQNSYLNSFSGTASLERLLWKGDLMMKYYHLDSDLYRLYKKIQEEYSKKSEPVKTPSPEPVKIPPPPPAQTNTSAPNSAFYAEYFMTRAGWEALEAKLAKSEKALANSLATCAKLQAEITDLRASNARLAADLDQNDKARYKLGLSLRNIQIFTGRLTKDLAHRDAQITTLQKQLTSAEQEIYALRAQLLQNEKVVTISNNIRTSYLKSKGIIE